RVVRDEYVPAHEAAAGTYRATFLEAIDQALRIDVAQRPQRIADWRELLLGPAPKRKADRAARRTAPPGTLLGRLHAAGDPVPDDDGAPAPAKAARPAAVPASLVPAPPDAPQRKGQLLDFIEGLRKRPAVRPPPPVEPLAPPEPPEP